MNVEQLNERIRFIDTCIEQFNLAVDKDVNILDKDALNACTEFTKSLYTKYTLSSLNSLQGIQKVTEDVMHSTILRDHVLAVIEQFKVRIGEEALIRLETIVADYTLVPANTSWEDVKDDNVMTVMVPKTALEHKYPSKQDIVGMLRMNRHMLYFSLVVMSGSGTN